MKFLCDRCKTRYAIADERVRGKILKIRCKNCSAVITVREGMDEAAEPTTATPPPAAAPSAPEAPPPAALEEEWYVSRDGNQEGPFTLTEAQAWIAARTADDDLFCWNEGFDDWLPVEKVSHFRGLRGAPRTRAATRPGVPKEPEPQPLFAATLAAIEAEAAADAAARPDAAAILKREDAGSGPAAISQLPPPKSPAPSPWKPAPTGEETVDAPMPQPPPRAATPAVGVPAVPRAATPAVGVPSLPRVSTPGAPAAGARPPVPGPFGASKTTPGVAAAHVAPAQPASQAAAPPGPNRNPFPSPTPTSSAAPLPSPPAVPNGTPSGPIPTAGNAAASPPAWSPPPPVAPVRPPAARFDTGEPGAAADTDGESAADPFAAAVAAAGPSTASFGDDDLEIGEVSRVVKLADLGKARAPASPATQTPKPRAPTASLGRATAGLATLPGPAPTAFSFGDAAPALDPGISMPAAPAPSRRNPIIYIAIAVIAIAAAVIAVVVLSSSSDDDAQGNETAGGADYDNLGYRPDDPIRRVDPAVAVDAGTVAIRTPDRGSGIRRPTGSGTGTNGGTGAGTGTGSATDPVPANPGLPDLTPDDVFAMSARMESGTRRCYERAMKDDPFLKVSKIRATISVSATGPVSDVRLSSMAGTPLGTCLVAAIKRWPFKPSKDGIVSEFALVFEQK